MIHPATRLRWIDGLIGYGVFATAHIPKGTILYVHDDLDLIMATNDVRLLDPDIKPHIDKYAYTNEHGEKVLCWDHAKFVNHGCDFNCMSTGFGFDIAVRDIHMGDEIRCEYSVLNLEEPLNCTCGALSCRYTIDSSDVDRFFAVWDKRVIAAICHIEKVNQPLLKILQENVKLHLFDYMDSGEGYPSVMGLKCQLQAPRG